MNYERPIDTVEDFGQFLLDTEDLDPLYVALNGADLERDQLRRLLFTYWCCYDSGIASYISEADGAHYWDLMRAMAANTTLSPLGGRWARGHERRHFRGQKAIDAVETYAKRFPEPERLLVWLEDETLRGRSFVSLRRRVLELPQFGPWIAFKVGDMMERVMGIPIDFTNADVMMFEQPYKSALMVGAQWESNGDWVSPGGPNDVVRKVSQQLISHFSINQAPPKRDRGVNIQEVETILCKFKSYLGGSYPLGLDSRELRHGLTHWAGVSQTAAKLLAAAPRSADVQ